MQPFTTLTSTILPLPLNDIDTDQIIPARYLKVTDKEGLAQGLFAGWRYQADGNPNLDFPLNLPVYQGSQVLLAGDNFGCGSSREHAPWALMGWGIRAVISTSFADIFRNNALKNGLLPVVVEAAALQSLFDLAARRTPLPVTIDLASQEVRVEGMAPIDFPIDPFNKICLLEGVDQLEYLFKREAQIAAYEDRHQAAWR